jgi:hypothetical protein
MPSNATGTLSIVVPVQGAARYAFSSADDLAALSAIPAGGIVLALPGSPSNGDSYAFADVDGSCSSGSPITIAPGAGTTIRGASTLVLTSAFSAGRLTFSAKTDSWAVESLTSTSAQIGWLVVNVPGGSTEALSRAPLQTVVLLGPDSTIELPEAPFSGDVVALSFNFAPNSAAPPVTLTNGGSGASIQSPLALTTFATSVSLIDAAGVYFYQYDAAEDSWSLLAGNSALPTYSGPLSPPANGSWSVPNWFIDPANTSGHASNSNSGTSAGAPLLTFAELVRRWGTTAPVHPQQTQVEFLSSQPNDTDPVVWNPLMLAGDIAVLTGALTLVQSGTLAGVVAKNRTTPQLLEATLGAGLSAGLLIQNTPRASQALLYKNPSGNVWALAQPLSNATVPPTLGPSEVNTWANGDAYTVSSVPTVNVVSFVPVMLEVFAVGCIQQLIVASPGGDGLEGLMLGVNVQTQNATVNKAIAQVGASDLDGQFVNTWLEAAVAGSPNFQGFAAISGGITNNLVGSGVTFDLDAIVTGTTNELSGANAFGTVYLEAASVVDLVAGRLAYDHGTATNDVIWGTGTLNLSGPATLLYNPTGLAANQFPGITLQLEGKTTAYSLATSGGVTTVHGGINLTAANLDAPAGAAGFGGLATNMGGCHITNGAQP